LQFRIVLIADSTGIALQQKGFNVKEILDLKEIKKLSVKDSPGYIANVSFSELLETGFRCNILFEASPVNLQHGDPGLSICKAALKSGIHLILANKGPLVLAFDELHSLAEQNNVRIMFSATVCGGLPIVNIGKNMICADIHLLRGIFNSTTNFILDEMESGRNYHDALQEAQQRGIAETDPSLDVGGWDTANKLLILARSVLGINCTLKDIKIEGITSITLDMIREANIKGECYKLIATAEKKKDSYELSVAPTRILKNGFLGSCSGWECCV